jgi:hypothetical protein
MGRALFADQFCGKVDRIEISYKTLRDEKVIVNLGLAD